MIEKNELEKLLLELLTDENGVQTEKASAVLGIYINRLSEDISKAITPITNINAPFIVAILERYAENIRRDFQCSEKIINMVKEAQSEKITMVLPLEKLNNEDDDDQ